MANFGITGVWALKPILEGFSFVLVEYIFTTYNKKYRENATVSGSLVYTIIIKFHVTNECKSE